MTSKRTRFQRKKRLLVAPGRQIDEVDHVIAAVRANTVVGAATLQCRICDRGLPLAAFKLGEQSKPEPTCMECASRFLRRPPAAVMAVEALAPVRPLSLFVAYRRKVVEDEEDAAYEEQFRRAMEDADGSLAAWVLEEQERNPGYALDQDENEC